MHCKCNYPLNSFVNLNSKNRTLSTELFSNFVNGLTEFKRRNKNGVASYLLLHFFFFFIQKLINLKKQTPRMNSKFGVYYLTLSENQRYLDR